MNKERLIKDLIRFEGISYTKYFCSADKETIKNQKKYTIGVGHLIRDDEPELLSREKPLTNAEVMVLLNKDLDIAIKEANKFIDPSSIEIEAWEIICHLSFWLGIPTLLKFKKAQQNLKDQDYVMCAEELLDSRLGKSEYKGIQNRITELSARMRDV
tara:strand:- start:1423 stop:1893 length:471 start_codon:yes stop_codon:yes gene_type:complete